MLEDKKSTCETKDEEILKTERKGSVLTRFDGIHLQRPRFTPPNQGVKSRKPLEDDIDLTM